MAGFVHVMDHIMILLEESGKDLHPKNLPVPTAKFVEDMIIKLG